MAAGAERYWKILPPLPAMISQFHPILANLVSTMQTKVFQVSCVAGIPLDRAPQTPIKKVTVYLPAAVLLTTPSPQAKAQQLASEVLRLEIVNDPQFKSGCYWETESTDVDLSKYGTPNLESSDGSKAWRN